MTAHIGMGGNVLIGLGEGDAAGESVRYEQLNPGKILQVVQSTNGIVGTTTSSTFADTRLAATITPTASTSKILVLVSHTVGVTINGRTCLRLARGATNVIPEIQALFTNAGTIETVVPMAIVDSPASASALTYKTQYRRCNGAGTAQVQADGDGVAGGSYMTLLEIGQ